MRVSASASAITYKVAMSTEKSAGVTLTASKTPRRLGPKRDRDRGWGAPHGRRRALMLFASLIAAISHGSRPPYRLIDSIAVPTAP